MQTLGLLALFCAAFSSFAFGAPIPSALTYQGSLIQDGNPANGSFSFRISLHSDRMEGDPIGQPITNSSIGVVNGVFTTQLDFGSNAFNGEARWIEIAVRRTEDDPFTILQPRQALTATPYALYALTPSGPPGPAGIKGEKGDDGMPGTKGETGVEGPAGAPGPQGATGAKGEPGLQGPPGSVGATGLAGAKGDTGEIGPLGPTGPKGEPGAAGPQGLTGPIGPQGPAGEKGDNGTQGFAGTVGSMGPKGEPGPQGSPGLPGATDGWSLTGNSDINPAIHFLGTTDSQPLILAVNSEPAIRILPNGSSPNIISGFSDNKVEPGLAGTVIVGGGYAGKENQVGNNYAAVLGGYGNTANGFASTVMGVGSTASGGFSIAMGFNTTASSGYAIAWGANSTASGYGSIAIGTDSTASGSYSLAMGNLTLADGAVSTAMGNRAKAIHNGSFVWADRQDFDFSSTAQNQFAIRASGGMFLDGRLGIGTSDPTWSVDVQNAQSIGRLTSTNDASGSVLILRNSTPSPSYLGAITFETASGAPGRIAYYADDHIGIRVGGVEHLSLDNSGNLTITGTLNPPSDRNVKKDFSPINSHEILDKLTALPIQTWSYTNDLTRRHIGPVAQDFHNAFGLNGADNKHIATVDADGVALAAIQGLNQKLEAQTISLQEQMREKDAHLARIESELAELKAIFRKMIEK